MSDFDRQDPPDPMKNVVGGLVSGQMSRDEFIKRAGLLGLSATAIGGMRLSPRARRPQPTRACRDATRGTTINLLVPAEGADRAFAHSLGTSRSNSA